jgi:hypothetical protein
MLRVMVHEDDAFGRLELPSWLAGRWCSKSIDDTIRVPETRGSLEITVPEAGEATDEI